MQPAHLEVLRIVGPGFFVDADDDGYYLAVRSGKRFGKRRDADARFYGPFSTVAEASFLAASACALGLA
jgi:hypothetical protein